MNFKTLRLVVLLVIGSAPFAAPATDEPKTITPPADATGLREALQPVPASAIFQLEGYYVWDPSVIEVDGVFHLFASRWPASAGMQGWKRSEIIRASSPSLFGPYVFREVVLPPASHPWATEALHNPKILRTGDRFLLYHLGIPRWQTGFAFADSIEGPWTPVSKPVIPTNNPAIVLRPDGGAYALGKFKPRQTKTGSWDAYMHAFTAPSIEGPYTPFGGPGNRLPEDYELEDPTVWMDRGTYHVLCTDWEGKASGIHKAVLHYASPDGVAYTLRSRVPVWSQADPLPLADGSSRAIRGVERPQVYLDARGAVAALLAAIHPAESAPTYVVIRPVTAFHPAPESGR